MLPYPQHRHHGAFVQVAVVEVVVVEGSGPGGVPRAPVALVVEVGLAGQLQVD